MFKNAFATLVWNKQIEEVKNYQKELIDYSYEIKNDSSSEYNSNTDGYQSKLLNLSHPLISRFVNDLKKYIINYANVFEIVSEFEIQIDDMWFNINQKNDYLLPHIHSQKDFSGVFFLKASQNSGTLVLENPDIGYQYQKLFTNNKNNFIYNCYNCQQFFIEPLELKLVLFPAHIKHFVTKNLTSDDRISVAFDVNIITKNENWKKQYV